VTSLFRRTAEGAGWISALRVLSRAMGFLATLVLARFLAPADFGTVAIGLAAAQVLETLSFIGVDEALIRARAPDRALYDTGFTLNVLRGVVIGVLLAACGPGLAAAYGDARLVAMLAALGLAAVVEGFVNVALVDYWRAMEFRREWQLTVVPRLVGTGLAVAIAWGSGSAWALIASVLVTRVLRVVVSYRLHPYRPRISLAARGALLGYSLWSAAQAGAVVLRDRAGTFLTARMLDPAGLGLFTIAWDVASTPTSELIAPLSRAAYSGFAAAAHAGEDEAQAYLRVAAAAGLLVMPVGWGLSLIAAPLIHLAYGAAWAGAAPSVAILAAVCGSTPFGYLAWTVVYARARMGTCFAITLGVALLRIVLLVALLPVLGVTGAAWATAASLAAESGLYLSEVVRRHGVRAADLLAIAWRPVVGVGAMAGGLVAMGLGWSWDVSTAFRQLALAVPAGAVIYAGVVFALWRFAGRPAGAESDIMALLRRVATARGMGKSPS
jgi:O-antigen/teichoic acid export membrane protein